MPLLPCVELEPAKPADASVIWLHGLGASGWDFEPIVPALELPEAMAVRFVFPHAPEIPVTINGGMVMPAWYDILAMDIERVVDEPQLRASAEAVAALIEREIARGVDSRRILLAGFSQGGAVAYHAALGFHLPLGGLLALSTYFATHRTLQPHPANRGLPILIQHGSYDSMVPEALGRQARALLEGMGYRPGYACYAMDHEVCGEQVADISAWIQARLGAG